jgi:hypothetical protein
MSDTTPLTPGSPEWEVRAAAYLAEMTAMIAEHGWALQGVFPSTESEGPGFVYTVGAALQREVNADDYDPELIVFGLPMNIGGSILNDVVAQHRNGQRVLVVGHRYDDILVGYDAVFIECSPEGVDAHLTLANQLVGAAREVPRVRALQLVWPDEDGRFPWEPGFSKRLAAVQPLLGAPPEGRETPCAKS